MDDTATDIFFYEDGTCSYCRDYQIYSKEIFRTDADKKTDLDRLISNIKKDKSSEYDCIIGLSGGADSTYVAYLAKKLGLNPLAVHLDNGWNSELAVGNIEKTVNNLQLDLYTHVIDWAEFRDVQLSFFKAGVLDLEMPTDHAIGVILHRLAKKHNIKYFLSGTNLATEAMMPQKWFFDNKLDPVNLKSIYNKFGSGRKLETFPVFSIHEYIQRKYFNPINVVSFLNLFDYNKKNATAQLEREINYAPYPVKHYESVFTRFYQGYILPKKFSVDKRRPFLSTMIMTGQMTRDEAMDVLSNDPYAESRVEDDKDFVLKKLGFSEEEFDAYLCSQEHDHLEYASITSVENFFRKKLRVLKKIIR